MKHKLFTLFLAVAASIGTMFASTKIGDLYYNLDATNQTAEVARNSSASGEIIIPASVEYNSVTYTVTSIGEEAFYECTGLTSVTIPNSVTSIGWGAIRECTGLTSVTIGNSVTSIGYAAFEGCSGLTSIEIPNSVDSIGNDAFYGCTGLTSPIYNAHIFAYMPTSYSSTYTIPDGIELIAGSAFASCSGLTSVTIPSSVISIGESAFSGCSGLTSVTIGNSVTSIGSWAFASCTGLTSVTIGNSVTSIGSWAFASCTGLTSIEIPNSVTSIGDYAFSGCSGLTSVTIGNSVTSIGGYAFSSCTGLTSVTIPNSVISIGESAFEDCRGLTSVTIGNSVTSIGYEAFRGCSGLTSIEIPNSVTSIGNYAFYQVLNINYSGSATGSPWGAKSVNGYMDGYLVYSDATKTVLLGCSSKAIGEIVIPNSVTSIGESAFEGCTGLTSVTIPNSVTSIGSRAFYGCTSLTSVTIPNSVTSIGYSAFWNVLNIVYNGTATGSLWGAKNMNGYVDGYLVYSDATKTVLLGCSSKAIGEIVIPNSVTSIGYRAFRECTGLTSITIPNSVTSIGESAFQNCGAITEVTIGSGLIALGKSVFNKCTAIELVHWNAINYRQQKPNQDSNCFPFYSSKDKISTFVFGDSVTYIPAYLLKDFRRLESIVIPAGVTEIGEYAFAGCRGLTSVTNYASTPQSISSNVFEEVNKSIPLYVPAGSVDAYKAADVWKEFGNIVGVDVPGEDPVETIPGDYSIYYVDKENQELSDEVVTLHVPVAPVITGFTFVRWQAYGDDIKDGITIQAVYQADEPSSAPAVYTNPANPAQKLIKNGNVYILTEDKTYTITGQKVK